MSNQSRNTLDDAIAAARAGRRDDATRTLRQLVANDPFNVDAWVWLGGVTPDAREQREALEHALRIMPDHQRARQGLDWLRQNRPDVFTDPTTRVYETRPSSERTTPNYGLPAVTPDQRPTQPVRASNAVGVYDAPTQAMAAPPSVQPVARPFDAPTQPMTAAYQPAAEPLIVGAPSQTDRMAAAPATPARPVSDAGYTDRMAAVPPPTTQTANDVRYQRSTGANIARWLLVVVWALGFGAVATLAALTFADALGFQQAVNPALNQYGLQLDPAAVESTRLGTGAVLGGIAIIDLIMLLGLAFRGRWAWVINLLIALAITIGTIALAVALFAFVPQQSSGFNVLSPTLQPLAGLIGFTLVFLILSFASRRAFFRRRVA